MNILFPDRLLPKAVWYSNGPNLSMGLHREQTTGSMISSSTSTTCELKVYAVIICLTYLHKEHSKRARYED